MIRAASTQERAVTSFGDFGVARAITVTVAIGLQLTGLYAVFATLGGLIAFGLYAVGALAALLPYVAMRRLTS